MIKASNYTEAFNNCNMGRNRSIDILKGIGISLVLVAHSLGGYVHTFAYSFHMPLFFLISGYFFHPKPIGETLRKDFTRLMIPFFFTTLLMFVVSCILAPLDLDGIKTPQYTFEALIYGNAANGNRHKIWGDFACVGSVWFLAALFWAKSVFNILYIKFNNVKASIILIFLSITSVVIGQYMLLPYSFIQGMTALPFLWIGYFLRMGGGDAIIHNTAYKTIFIILAILWLASTFQSSLNMASIEWKYYYIPNVLLATVGTGVIYMVSSFINSHLNGLATLLAFLGKYSIVLVCFPVVESYLIPLKDLIPTSVPFHGIVILGCKTLWVVLTLWLTINTPFLRRVFSIK